MNIVPHRNRISPLLVRLKEDVKNSFTGGKWTFQKKSEREREKLFLSDNELNRIQHRRPAAAPNSQAHEESVSEMF